MDFEDDPALANHPGQCPHPVGSDAWKAWQRSFTSLSEYRDALAGSPRRRLADERLAALKANTPARTEQQRRHDELMAEVEAASAVRATTPSSSGANGPIVGRYSRVIFVDVRWRQHDLTSHMRSVITKAYRDMAKSIWDAAAALDAAAAALDAAPGPEVRTIRGKPAGKVKNPVCPQHGQPRGSCRRCWR